MVDIFVSDPRIFLSGFTGLVAIRYIDFVISCAITANDALIVIQRFTLSPKFAKQASAYNAK